MYDQDAYHEGYYPSPYHPTAPPNMAPKNELNNNLPRKSVKSRLGVRVEGNQQQENNENVIIGQEQRYRTKTPQHSRTLSPLRANHGLINSPLVACPGTPLRDEWIVVDETIPTPTAIRSFPVKRLAESIMSAIDDLRPKIPKTETVPCDQIDLLSSQLCNNQPTPPGTEDNQAPAGLPDMLSCDLRSRLSRRVSPNRENHAVIAPGDTPVRDEPSYDSSITSSDCNRNSTPPTCTHTPSSKILVHWVDDACPAVPQTLNSGSRSPSHSPLGKRRCISLRGCNEQSPIPAIINRKPGVSPSLSAKPVLSGSSQTTRKAATRSNMEAPKETSSGKKGSTDIKVSSIPVKLTKKSLSSLPAWAQLGISDYLGENKAKEGTASSLKEGAASRTGKKAQKQPAANINLSRTARKLLTALKKVITPSASSASSGPPSGDEKITSSSTTLIGTLAGEDRLACQATAPSMSLDPPSEGRKIPAPLLTSSKTLGENDPPACPEKVAAGFLPPVGESSQEDVPTPDKQDQEPAGGSEGDTTAPSSVPSPEGMECPTDKSVGSGMVEESKAEDPVPLGNVEVPTPDCVTEPSPPVKTGPSHATPDITTTEGDEDSRTPTPLGTPRVDNLDEDSGLGSMLQDSSSLSPDSTPPPVQEGTLKQTDKSKDGNLETAAEVLKDGDEPSQPPTLSAISEILLPPAPHLGLKEAPVQDDVRRQTLGHGTCRTKTMKRPHEAFEDDKATKLARSMPPKKLLEMKVRPSKKARRPQPFDTTASPVPTGPVTQLQMDLDQIFLSIRRVFLINHMTYSNLPLDMERDTCVAAMKATTQAYSHFNLVEKEGRQDFSCWQVRWGYVFMYLMRHAHLVFLSLKHIHLGNRAPTATQMPTQSWKIPFDCGGSHVNAFLRKCALPGVLRVVAIGGGPGSDLIGLAMFLRANNFPVRIRAAVFDKCGHWSKSWEDLHRELPASLAYYFEPVQYIPFDYLHPEMSQLHHGFLSKADLVTVIKSMSPVATKLRAVKPMRLPNLGLVKAHSLFNILSSVAPGAIVLYLDNKNGLQNRVMQETVQSIPGFTMVHYETTTEKLPGRGGFSPLCQKFMKWVGYGPSFCSGNNEIVALSRQWWFEYGY